MTTASVDTSRSVSDRTAPSSRWPSDAFYGRLQWTLLGVLAFLVLYGFVIARFVSTPRELGFRMVIFSMLCFNVLWWSIADRRFARHVPSAGWSRALRGTAAVFCLLLNLPIFYMLVAGRTLQFFDSPTWYAAAVTIWHIGLVTCMPIVAGLRLAWLGVAALARRSRRLLRGIDAAGRPRQAESPVAASPLADSSPTAAAGDTGDVFWSRRALLKTAFATGPMALLVGATGISQSREGQVLIRRHEVSAPWLPERLRGLTISHISDLHVGRHYRPWMLGRMIDAVNKLDSDLVIVTGDIVDSSNQMLPPAIGALKQLAHRYGIFLSIGNHDMIDSRAEFVQHMREHLPLLINERRTLVIGGERLTVAGLDYSNRSTPVPGGRRSDTENAMEMLRGYEATRDGPIVAMAHHPHAWDVLGPMGVPLTLSGHTHGGQIMFTPPDSASDLGIGQMLFRYLRGFYHRPGETLFVNSGVGNWFPLRIHAPAEVVQLQLV